VTRESNRVSETDNRG